MKNSQIEKIITVTKDDSYQEGLGDVGETGTLSYEVVEENDKLCRIKILDVTQDDAAENSGDAFRNTMTKKGRY